jgi:hypothetical protein
VRTPEELDMNTAKSFEYLVAECLSQPTTTGLLHARNLN